MDYCSIHLGFLIAILVFSVGQAAAFDGKLYWKSRLPNIPMAQPVLDALPMDGDSLRAAADNKNNRRATAEDMLRAYGVEDDHSQEDDHMNHSDDFVTTRFFLAKDLLLGTKLSIGFKTEGNFTRFPPHRLAQIMPPFNSNNIDNILRFFSIEPESTEARVILFNLHLCERNDHINGNLQYCANTLEQLVSYLGSTLGGSGDVRAVSLPPSAFKRDKLITYKVVEINALATEKYMVACHRGGFPYALFKCHQPQGTTVYQITLAEVDDGTIVNGYAVCHFDTTGWNPKFIGLETLGVTPGTPICHFLQSHDAIWYRPSQAIE